MPDNIHRCVIAGFILAALAASGCSAALVNPGFEEMDAGGTPAGWRVLSRLDSNGYGGPDFRETFDEIVPTSIANGRLGSGRCAGFPGEGLWGGRIRDHLSPGGRTDTDGRRLGKAALCQTVSLEPGTYTFGAYLRTAEGDAYTAAFSLGWNYGSPAAYANDGSTGIRWSSDQLGLKTSFDGTGFLSERGEWTRCQTAPITVSKRQSVTVWVRLNYFNNNSMRTRWQIDDAFIEPYRKPSVKGTQKVKPTTGAPLQHPLPGQIVVDCADGDEPYLVRDSASTVREKIPRRLFQHARCAKGSGSFTYRVPVENSRKVVYLAFEHLGPVRVTIEDEFARADETALPDVLYAKELVLTDASLWWDGWLDVRFECPDPAKELAVVWMETGPTTRFRERLKNIEWDTTSVPWRVGLWDGSANEFRGSERRCIPGRTDCADLKSDDLRIEWTQRAKPGHRYYLVLGHIKAKPGDGPGLGYVNIGDDDTVEWIGKTKGEEAYDLDVTDWIRDGANVVSVQADAIDYVALIETLPGITDNRKLRLYIGGDELAENLTRVYHNSLFWLLSLHYDDSGFVDASVPHGKWWQQYWPIDISFAMRSMLCWGLLDQSERVAVLVAQQLWQGHQTNRSGGADNNGGNILAMDMCEILCRRGFEKKITSQLWPSIRGYCDSVCSAVDSSPFGLIKGTNWENAGNLKQGPCYALSTNLMASWLLLKAADTAKEGGLGSDAGRWKQTAARIRREVLDRLVFREDVKSPSGWVYPKGTWAYGIMDDGSYMLEPLAGYLWAGKFGSGYYGFVDPDPEIRRLYRLTEEVAAPLFARGQEGLVSGYATSYDGTGSTIASTALSDRTDIMDRLVGYLAGETDYKKDHGQPKAEVSRWAYGVPGWEEDTNLVGTADFLDLPRYITGVDDVLFRGAQLRLIPRLPARWNECGVNDWSVQYLNGGTRASTTLSYNYVLSGSQAALKLRTENSVKGLRVRVGPFPAAARLQSATVGGRSARASTENSGGRLWVWTSVDSNPAWQTILVTMK